MGLQKFLIEKFKSWSPPAPEVLERTKHSIALDWGQVEPFHFMADNMLYRVEKYDKMPPWFVVYRGNKTTKEIDNLAPRHPHRFRVKVIIKTEAVATLAERAVQFYGDEDKVYDIINCMNKHKDNKDNDKKDTSNKGSGDGPNVPEIRIEESGIESNVDEKQRKIRPSSASNRKWIESQWSEQTWTSTDTDGSSAVCFCMAVRCGYLKQVQGMMEERPELIGILNPANGFTPLATAVRKGDINTVRCLVSLGAEIDQPSATGQTPLHLAVLHRRLPIADLLLERGADLQAKDMNGLRVEHYAVDSCDVTVIRYVFDKGGDVKVEDNNGWTPLFRALCQGADTGIIEELVVRGSELQIADKAGLPLTSVARIMTNRHGRNRDSVLRLVDMNYPHEAAMANFTRLTKKIYNVHTLFKLPTLSSKVNLKK